MFNVNTDDKRWLQDFAWSRRASSTRSIVIGSGQEQNCQGPLPWWTSIIEPSIFLISGNTASSSSIRPSVSSYPITSAMRHLGTLVYFLAAICSQAGELTVWRREAGFGRDDNDKLVSGCFSPYSVPCPPTSQEIKDERAIPHVTCCPDNGSCCTDPEKCCPAK
jgi:hypothetical protein